MSGPLPGVVRCLGAYGCHQVVDLGADPDRRGARLIDHLREDPEHEGIDLALLLQQIALVPA